MIYVHEAAVTTKHNTQKVIMMNKTNDKTWNLNRHRSKLEVALAL